MVTETKTESVKREYVFDLIEETEIPKTTYEKGSIYDPIVDKFIESPLKLVSLKPDADQTANYLRTQIVKRLEAKKLLGDIKASVVNNKVYLQKIVKPNVEVEVKTETQTEVK